MPKLLSDPDLVRVQLRLKREDYKRLAAMAASAPDTNIGVSTIVRNIVHTWLGLNEARVRSRIDAQAAPPLMSAEDLESILQPPIR
jgi:hypothetical protein